jgi:hypothetical protein
MWPVTFHERTPSIPPPLQAGAQLEDADCADELKHAEAREDVCAVRSKVKKELCEAVARVREV